MFVSRVWTAIACAACMRYGGTHKTLQLLPLCTVFSRIFKLYSGHTLECSYVLLCYIHFLV